MDTAAWDFERPCSWVPAFAGMTKTGWRVAKPLPIRAIRDLGDFTLFLKDRRFRKSFNG
jgi:putative heme iron utilization protein